jgi:hypothetical protein
MVDGTFIQIAPVALPTAQGTVRGTQEHLEMLRQYLELAKAAVPKVAD